MSLIKASADVYYTSGPVVELGAGIVARLKREAAASPRGRCRICAHATADNPLHEMIIALDRRTYIRPHQHLERSESFHVIDGRVDVVVFDAAGAIAQVLEMGAFHTGLRFYYRMSEPLMHTVLVRSDCVVFHETTRGPFRRDDTLFAPWAPAEGDVPAIHAYLQQLNDAVAQWCQTHRTRAPSTAE